MIKWYDKDLCEKGFIINLESRPDRRESSINECSSAGINGVEIFNAAVINDENYVAYGCTQSHYNLYEYQVSHNIEYMLILEDDIKTVYNYNFSENLNISNLDKRKKYVYNLIDTLYEIKPDILWLGTRCESIVDPYNDYLSYSNKTLTSHAYLCSLNFAKFALENLDYKNSSHFSFRWPIDHFLSQVKVKDCGQLLANKHNTNFVKNNLITTISNCLIFNQKSDYSNILNRYTDYGIWIMSCHEEYCFKPVKENINYNEYI